MCCLRTGKSPRIFSTSKPAAITLLSVLMEFLEEELFQLLAQVRDLDPVDDVLRKRVSQQDARLLFAEAARLQIEQRFGIQLAEGSAVRATGCRIAVLSAIARHRQ